jgi:2-hydroxycyclohexanecarboxyl-CoA dehydrogenase
MAWVRAASPAMVEQSHGAVVSNASTAAFGEPRQGVCAAAKAGVVACIRTIAVEYGRHGVRANLVAPGLTLPDDAAAVDDQSLWRDRRSVINDAEVDYVVKNTALRRLPKSQDIANAVVFLASNSARRLNTVAGGFAIR